MNDTHPTAAQVQVDLLRMATPSRRAEIALSLSRGVVELSRRALRDRYPEWDENEIGLEFVRLNYGADLAARVRTHLAGPKPRAAG